MWRWFFGALGCSSGVEGPPFLCFRVVFLRCGCLFGWQGVAGEGVPGVFVGAAAEYFEVVDVDGEGELLGEGG